MDLILFRLSLAPFANNRVAVILMDKKINNPIAENAIQLPMLSYGLMGSLLLLADFILSIVHLVCLPEDHGGLWRVWPFTRVKIFIRFVAWHIVGTQ